jgi:hypothetical protein
MFFPPMNKEMQQHIINLNKKNITKPSLTYKEYYTKRFAEECKDLIANPKFSMKYMMIMTYMQKNIKEKTLKEYKEKYPGYPLS